MSHESPTQVLEDLKNALLAENVSSEDFITLLIGGSITIKI
jgi:hypothetical protein